MGYVRLISAYQSEDVMNPAVSVGCNSPMTLHLAIGAIRCVPVAQDDGALPDEESMWESSLALLADMTALFAAANCCRGEIIVGAFTPQGPQGGCAGGEWEMWVSL